MHFVRDSSLALGFKDMIASRVVVDCSRIHDWDSFHVVFAEAFGFPELYGWNMDAWIDCLTSLDVPKHGMTKLRCARCNLIALRSFKDDAPSSTRRSLNVRFVNWGRNDTNEASVIALSFYE